MEDFRICKKLHVEERGKDLHTMTVLHHKTGRQGAAWLLMTPCGHGAIRRYVHQVRSLLDPPTRVACPPEGLAFLSDRSIDVHVHSLSLRIMHFHAL